VEGRAGHFNHRVSVCFIVARQTIDIRTQGFLFPIHLKLAIWWILSRDDFHRI
jgi:hypothetical protein